MFIRTNIRKIKEKLVKRVILKNITIENDMLGLKFQLKNFFNPRKEIKVHLHSENVLKEVSYKLKKDSLCINISNEDISIIENGFKLIIYINGKKMWLTDCDSRDLLDEKTYIIVNNNYYSVEVDRDILVRKLFQEYNFSNDTFELNKIEVETNELYFEFEECNQSVVTKPIEIYGIKEGRIIQATIDTTENDKIFKVDDLVLFSSGLWKIFIKHNEIMFPIEISQTEFKTIYTVNHEVEIVNLNGILHLSFLPHVRENVEQIKINVEENGKFNLKFVNFSPEKQSSYKLVIRNSMNNTDDFKDVYSKGRDLSASLHVDDLIKNNARKSFFILKYKENHPYKIYQFDLSQIMFANKEFDVNINSEIIKLIFYKRRDKSLGIRINRPRLIKVITKIDNNFNIRGYLGSTERFIDCNAYLIVEDRYTKEYIESEIEDYFNINLLKHQLLHLKGKDKTVMDFFVVIKNKQNEIIRKEKIKYKYADYKKDNYYASNSIYDAEDNNHYFLITTTPFNNLKVESFMLPNYIDLKSDYSKKDENIWLIGERYDTAQDNGIVLYNWLRENTNIDAYYVISSDAKDYSKLKEDSNVLEFGSPKHYKISLKAKVLLGTHDLENLLPYKPAYGFFNYEDTYKVFLQHGVLGRKNVEYHKKYYELPFNLFIVSSDPEKYDVVVDKLGYDEKEVEVTGLARFDKLQIENNPKDILLMPTWRDWINTDEQFLSSQYFELYSSLIHNKELLEILDNYNVNLNFYPHYRAQEYFKTDVSYSNDRVHFIELGSKKVQELLINHALLITDYSSVSFDFTLMNKPVIYYHFDARRFFRQGILRPIDETFIGKIATNEEELINLIKDRIIRNFENYDVDITNIIKYQDTHNSKRIYRAVKANLKKQN